MRERHGIVSFDMEIRAFSKPATTTVEVNGFTRKGARIEIEVVAVSKNIPL